MTAVYSCVRILSEAVAGLPLQFYRYNDNGGKEKAVDHPLYFLLHDEPNPEMTSFVFRETLMTHLLLWGNAYSQIIRNGKGEVVALYPLMPDRMTVDRDEHGRLYYEYLVYDGDDVDGRTGTDPKANGKIVRLHPADVLHIPGLGFDGLVGYSPIAMAKNAIGLIKLQQEDHKSFSTIHTIRGVVRPAFQMAVDDDLIRKNPFEFQMATVLVNDAVTREAITRKEERTFLEFIKNDTHYSKYYDGMYILFKTGMRISEFTGLTLSDLDFENRTINIDHQLQKTGTLVYIDTTKTYAGRRVIPMTDDVYEAFQNIVKARPKLKVEPMIDGYSGFLCFDKDNKPMVAMHWEKYFQHAVDRYNSIYRVQLPKITPHVCRHTYCSNMAKSGMNPKVLQYLMGHSDISVTLNTYTHLKIDDAKEEMEKLAKAQAATEEISKANGQEKKLKDKGWKMA